MYANATLCHVREPQLPHCFIRNDGNRIGKIEAPGLIHHRNTETLLRILLQQAFWQSFRFFAKYQQIILGKTDIGIALFRFRCQKIKMMSLIFFLDFRKIFMYLYIDQRPVIESGPFQIFIFKGKAQRFDKVQGNMIGRTEAPYCLEFPVLP